MQKVTYYLKGYFSFVTSGQRLIVLFIILILIAGCDRSGEMKSEQPLEKVILGVGTGLFMSPVWIAANNGYFKEQGLDVTIRKYNTGKNALRQCLRALLNFQLQPLPLSCITVLKERISLFSPLSVILKPILKLLPEKIQVSAWQRI